MDDIINSTLHYNSSIGCDRPIEFINEPQGNYQKMIELLDRLSERPERYEYSILIDDARNFLFDIGELKS